MKLEIIDAEDKGDRIVLKMNYDEEFARTIAKICGVKYASEEDVEEFIMMVLENMSGDDLGLTELGDEIDE
jgi:hypothetical protein